jgi:hypothetical protein
LAGRRGHSGSGIIQTGVAKITLKEMKTYSTYVLIYKISK